MLRSWWLWRSVLALVGVAVVIGGGIGWLIARVFVTDLAAGVVLAAMVGIATAALISALWPWPTRD